MMTGTPALPIYALAIYRNKTLWVFRTYRNATTARQDYRNEVRHRTYTMAQHGAVFLLERSDLGEVVPKTNFPEYKLSEHMPDHRIVAYTIITPDGVGAMEINNR